MKELYFCVFSDYHYWPGNYPHGTGGMRTILEDAHRRGAQCIVHCGDFVHGAPDMPEMVDLYRHNPYGIPAFGCLGNHELEAADSLEAVIACYGMANNYVYYDFEGFRLILLDTNYYEDEAGVLHHNPPRKPNAPRKPEDCLPPEELAWLREAVFSSPNPCLLFSHASFEMDVGCPQAAQVRQILNEANAAHPGRVLMCLNGHYHRNSIASHDGIVYMDVNTVYNGEWFWQPHDCYPKDFATRARLIPHLVMFEDPLHAFVRVREDGTVDVEGMETRYQMGVSPEVVGIDCTNRFGRKTEPRISFFHQDAVWKV